jgi:hypothetical protein
VGGLRAGFINRFWVGHGFTRCGKTLIYAGFWEGHDFIALAAVVVTTNRLPWCRLHRLAETRFKLEA